MIETQELKLKKRSDFGSLIVGQVDFLNCLPINLSFNELNKDIEKLSTIPSRINELIKNELIDIAPISSYEYLKNKDKLELFADMCIASNGPADSVLLFSDFPIEELNDKKVALSHASATSNKLLQIILEKFYKVSCKYKIESVPLNNLHIKYSSPGSRYSAGLLIGDLALIETTKIKSNKYIYDLGELWKKHTGLPMVFATWVIRKDALKSLPEKAKEISNSLQRAKEIGLTEKMELVIEKSTEKIALPKEFYSNYFKHLSYDMTNDCKKGLELFESYCS